jgi:dipeptidyl aminopeptidase/acylaminoacyl peptidase
MRVWSLWCLFFVANVCHAAEPPPLAAFFDNAAFTGAELSPDGRSLAVKIGGNGHRDLLAVIDLATGVNKIVANFRDADVDHVEWVNDERLIFDTTDKTIGQGDIRYGPGLYAVSRDGGKVRQLAKHNKPFITDGSGQDLLPWHTFLLQQRGAQNSPSVYVANYNISDTGFILSIDLLRLNTITGRATEVDGPAKVQRWLLDERGEPRLALVKKEGKASWLVREGDNWRELVSFDAYTGGEGAFMPLGFGADGKLYVRSSKGRDTDALFTYDLATGSLGKAPLVEVKGYDFSGALIASDDKVLGVRVLADANTTLWYDPAMKALQAKVDALLPGTVNMITPPRRPAAPWVLVQAYSDLQPKVTLVYNTETGTLKKVGESHPQIKPAQMGDQEVVRYTARDGLQIPGWLTLPSGAKRNGHLPLVVLVHGGPYVRGGEWGWRPDSQFLASRGYAVLEPEYRGSTGYGGKHFRAGWKQWGLGMQNDIADGAKWAIAEGIADPKRICIAGASYGGYATLMGLINDPDLFKCGIDWVGVTDIGLLYTGTWWRSSDTPEDYKRFGMPTLIGDLKADADQLKATSPLAQAARIKQPLLLAYGGADRRVPIFHGRKFYDAVKATNSQVEWIEYEEEGHGWALPKNRIDFWGRVEKFLDKQIGKKE